jgi:hypothetical protein
MPHWCTFSTFFLNLLRISSLISYSIEYSFSELSSDGMPDWSTFCSFFRQDVYSLISPGFQERFWVCPPFCVSRSVQRNFFIYSFPSDTFQERFWVCACSRFLIPNTTVQKCSEMRSCNFYSFELFFSFTSLNTASRNWVLTACLIDLCFVLFLVRRVQPNFPRIPGKILSFPPVLCCRKDSGFAHVGHLVDFLPRCIQLFKVEFRRQPHWCTFCTFFLLRSCSLNSSAAILNQESCACLFFELTSLNHFCTPYVKNRLNNGHLLCLLQDYGFRSV